MMSQAVGSQAESWAIHFASDPSIALRCGVPGDELLVEPLYRGALADSMEVLLARGRQSRRRFVVLYSPDAEPFAADRVAQRSTAAAAALDGRLSMRIARPLLTGRLDGRSYCITPFLQSFAASGLFMRLQKARVRGAVLEWLYQVASRTCVQVRRDRLDAEYLRPLQAIAESPDFSADSRRAAEGAHTRVQNGRWHPAHCLMHGNLWWGNMMLRPQDARRRREPWGERLRFIDWGGSMTQGYPIYDLLRGAESLGLSARLTGEQLAGHCSVLRCQTEDARGYLFAALGATALEPGCFPRENLARLVDQMGLYIRGALAGRLN